MNLYGGSVGGDLALDAVSLEARGGEGHHDGVSEVVDFVVEERDVVEVLEHGTRRKRHHLSKVKQREKRKNESR